MTAVPFTRVSLMDGFRVVLGVLAVACSVTAAEPSQPAGRTPQIEAALPMGYDHPESDQGGPFQPQGAVWLDKVWNRRTVLAEKLPGGPLRVVLFPNRASMANVAELTRYLPVDYVAITVPSSTSKDGAGSRCHEYQPEDFDAVRKALASEEKIDVFFIARVAANTIPDDIVYAILKRVKNGESGLVLQDIRDVFNPENTLGLKASGNDKQLIPGIPYEGLQMLENQKHSGRVNYDPQPKPFSFGGVASYPFGKGRIIAISSASRFGDIYWGTSALVSGIPLARNMWVETDYLYSHTAKALLMTSGRAQAVQITGLKPRGASDGTQIPEVTMAATGGAFQGTLRWHIRDTWGLVSAQGKQVCQIPAEGCVLRIEDARFENAGPQYLDAWIDNANGETVDWGSTFVDVDRHVTAPAIALKYPESTPRGQPLAGAVTVSGTPDGATLRLTLVDRHWRDVGRISGPADARLRFSFPVEGLEGQVWIAQADTLDPAGHILSRAWTEIHSPHTKATIGNWNPVATLVPYGSLDQSAGRRLLRSIGFKAHRGYGGWDAIEAAGLIWDDIQAMPFAYRISGPYRDFFTGNVTDYEEPAARKDLLDSIRTLATVLKPYGLFGMNLTDDSGPAQGLALGAYTVIQFHDWLKAQYGDFDGVCKAWGWTPPEETVAENDLPLDPYIQVAFHQWLQKKYGGLEALNAAWKMGKPESRKYIRQYGGIHQRMIQLQREDGNTAPASDVAEFKKAYAGAETKADPFGRITGGSIQTAQEAGFTAASIDALRYMEEEWIGVMVAIKNAAQEVQPDCWVGTDAAFYGPGLASCYTQLPYVAPYYDHSQLKLAVACGRMERPGLYGVCLGAYGEKKVNMSGQRGQIWDVALSGGTGFYYWGLGNGGLRPDFTFSDTHARYQSEVAEELNRGLGELLTGYTPMFQPIAILSSQTSGLCDALDKKKEPATSHAASFKAFQSAFEDMGLNPWPITSEQLASGWLKTRGAKLLVLPGANSMSDREIEAVKRFVSAGGVVVADVLPGRRYPNGILRTQWPLADSFGVSTAPQGTDDKVQVSGLMKENGRAFLLNASFNNYEANRVEGGDVWTPWNEVMKKVVATAGVAAPFPFTSQGKATPGFGVTAFSSGKSVLIGVVEKSCADFTGERRPIEIALPGPRFVYDVRAGKTLGEVTRIEADLPRNGQRVYAVLPYKVKSLAVTTDKPVVQAGENLTLQADLAISPAGRRDLHFCRVEAFDPKGQSSEALRRLLPVPARGALTVPLTTAYDDPPGTWKFVVTDIASGASGTVSVQVKGDAQ